MARRTCLLLVSLLVVAVSAAPQQQATNYDTATVDFDSVQQAALTTGPIAITSPVIANPILPIATSKCTPVTAAPIPTPPPHIIFILADDLGYNDVGFMGANQNQTFTPNIDMLAEQGVILDQHYAMPVCSPSRATLMTGRLSIHTHSQHFAYMPGDVFTLPRNETTMAQYMKSCGYNTHMIGKWHLGCYLQEYTPTGRGFDTHFGYYSAAIDYFNYTISFWNTDHASVGNDLHDNLTMVQAQYQGQYAPDVFAARAVNQIMNQNPSTPLFLYFASLAVHSGGFITAPLQYTPDRYARCASVSDENRRQFCAMRCALDDSVGAIWNALVAKNMTSNTIIVFSSDNGGPASGLDNNFANNYPLRGTKATLWEGGVRVPAFLWASPSLLPTRFKPYRSQQLMHLSDWLPTLYGRAKAFAPVSNTTTISSSSSSSSKTRSKPSSSAVVAGPTTPVGSINPNNPSPFAFDGFDMWNALVNMQQVPSVRSDLLINYDAISKQAAIRTSDGWKLYQGGQFDWQWNGWYRPEGDTAPTTSIGYCRPPDDARHACVNNPDATGWSAPCLFDVSSDPCEWRNVAWQYPDVVASMQARLENYIASTLPYPNLPSDMRVDPAFNNNSWTCWMEPLGGTVLEAQLQANPIIGQTGHDYALNPLTLFHGFSTNTSYTQQATTLWEYASFPCRQFGTEVSISC